MVLSTYGRYIHGEVLYTVNIINTTEDFLAMSIWIIWSDLEVFSSPRIIFKCNAKPFGIWLQTGKDWGFLKEYFKLPYMKVLQIYRLLDSSLAD